MARTATVRLTSKENDNDTVTVKLVYDDDNRWSCLPGYLSASKGTWDTSWIYNRVYLYDGDGKIVAVLYGVDVNMGYPFDDLAGTTGSGDVATGGVVGGVTGKVTWEFLTV